MRLAVSTKPPPSSNRVGGAKKGELDPRNGKKTNESRVNNFLRRQFREEKYMSVMEKRWNYFFFVFFKPLKREEN